MPRVTLYYITCGEITGNPDTVVLASTDYEAVTARRDGIEARTDESACSGVHPIRHKEVAF